MPNHIVNVVTANSAVIEAMLNADRVVDFELREARLAAEAAQS